MMDVRSLLNSAIEYIRKKDYRKALAVLEDASRLNKNPETAAVIDEQAAMCYLYAEEAEKAVEIIRRLLKRGGSVELLELAVMAYEKYGEFDDGYVNALKKLQSVSDGKPSAKIACKILEYHRRRGNWDELKRELDFLEEKGDSGPWYDIFYFFYYNNFLEMDKAFFHFNRYYDAVPPDRRSSDFVGNTTKALMDSLYVDALTDERYIEMMNIVYASNAVKNANAARTENNRLFRKLRVGFVSYDFNMHVVGFFISSLFKTKLTFSAIEYFAYDTRGKSDDFINRVIKERADVFKDVSALSGEELTELIIGDKIDILFDLNGFSFGSRAKLFASRLAPVQITWIGYPGTSAVPNMDYTIVDNMTDPPGLTEKFYTEKLLYMDKTFLCFPFDPHDDIITGPPFERNGFVTFGTVCNLKKYSAATLALWKRVLDGTPGSKFFVKAEQLRSGADEEKLGKRLAAAGFDMERIEFHRKSSYKDYLNNYNSIDIILDTYPFNGATTTCDAFSMSVPIVSLCGRTHVSRVGYQMLNNVGLPELAAQTPDEYVDIAVSLANDLPRLKKIRTSLSGAFRNSPLADEVGFKIEFENKLRDAYICFVLSEGAETAPAGGDVNELLSEVLAGLYYLQYFSDSNEASKMRNCRVINDCVKTQLSFCRLLESHYRGNQAALALLQAYKRAVYSLNRTPRDKLLPTIDSLLEYIRAFRGKL